jgi:hypothetical protein
MSPSQQQTPTNWRSKMKLEIMGYEQEGKCEHCGRNLIHCIKLSDGRIVGATCFDKKMTKAKTYNGKKYRIGADKVIYYAQLREFGKLNKAGIPATSLVFDAA